MATPPCERCSQPSVYYCSCQSPPVPYCHPCSYIHHETPGTHVWFEFQQQVEKKNIFCQMCSTKLAEIACCCDFPLTLLCIQCRSEHTQKDRLAMHLEQPIEKAEMITSLGDIERARRVLENKSRIEKYLNLNKTAVLKLKDEVNALAEELILQINSAREETLEELSEAEKEIDEMRNKLKQEVELHLFDAERQCSDELAREAFDTSRQFACEETLSGELLREGKIESRLARLHLPPLLAGSKGRPQREVAKENRQEEERKLGQQTLPVRQVASPIYSPPENLTKEMIDEVHATCREDFGTSTPEVPATIGRHRLPIASLQGEPWVKGLIEVHPLEGEYSSWRRSLGDGNSFYRCAGVLFCEHFCRHSTPAQEFDEVCRQILEQKLPFLFSSGRGGMANIMFWSQLLNHLCSAKASQENVLQQLQYYLQRPRCDKAIVAAVREYTATCCRQHANDPDSSAAQVESPDSLIEEILEYGKEAREVALRFTAQALSVILHVFTADLESGRLSKATYGPRVRGRFPAMHLLRCSGQYSVLIPKHWDAADGYDFDSNRYSPVDAVTTGDYEEYDPD